MVWHYADPREVTSLPVFVERIASTMKKLATAARCYEPVTQLTYGTTVRPGGNLTRAQLIEVTNTSAFTIANPEQPREGATITLDIYNNSGGTMGTITWGDEYALDGTVTNPADGDHLVISFYCAPEL